MKEIEVNPKPEDKDNIDAVIWRGKNKDLTPEAVEEHFKQHR